MNKEVLIVDDEELQRHLISETLQTKGFSTRGAVDGEEALRLLDQYSFDLIITDYQMPGLSGIELVKEAGRKNPNIPFIIVTGYADVDSVIKALNYGVVSIIKKPFEPGELMDQVMKCLIQQNISDVLMQSAKMAGLGELTASVAHELRNALAEIKMAVSVMKKIMGEKGELDKYMDILISGVNRSDRIIGHLLTFSRKSKKRTIVHLTSFFENLLTLVDDRIRLQCIQVEKKIEEGQFYGIMDSLNIIFLNLIVNAIHAMESGGTLFIEGELGEELDITIGDTGTGIDEEDLNRIYEMFYTTKGEKGTGIGLHLVRKEVERLGGSIRCESEKGVGTKFMVTIPLSYLSEEAVGEESRGEAA